MSKGNTDPLASVRILDAKARNDRELKASVPSGPDATAWLSLLAQVRSSSHPRSGIILNDLHEKLYSLSERLQQEGVGTEAFDVLQSAGSARDPLRPLAEAICMMMGEKLLRTNYLKFLDSAAMSNEPHGLVMKRRISRVSIGGKRKSTEARSVVLSDTMVEALAHRYLAGSNGRFSFGEFLHILRDSYGLFVDEAPPGLAASREDLLRNRAILERRLRDLGLLVGVNDAEAMKHLRPRYRFDAAS